MIYYVCAPLSSSFTLNNPTFTLSVGLCRILESKMPRDHLMLLVALGFGVVVQFRLAALAFYTERYSDWRTWIYACRRAAHHGCHFLLLITNNILQLPFFCFYFLLWYFLLFWNDGYHKLWGLEKTPYVSNKLSLAATCTSSLIAPACFLGEISLIDWNSKIGCERWPAKVRKHQLGSLTIHLPPSVDHGGYIRSQKPTVYGGQFDFVNTKEQRRPSKVEC